MTIATNAPLASAISKPSKFVVVSRVNQDFALLPEQPLEEACRRRRAHAGGRPQHSRRRPALPGGVPGCRSPGLDDFLSIYERNSSHPQKRGAAAGQRLPTCSSCVAGHAGQIDGRGARRAESILGGR
jgi:hypothetical protein